MITFSRSGRPPIELLKELKETDPAFAEAAEKRIEVVKPKEAKPLGALQRHPSGSDPNELIKSRFLCRGGSLVLAGPTGIGKSSLMMQLSILFSIGEPCFALQPSRSLKVMIVQAENDEGDMAEMRDGVIGGLDLKPSDRSTALSNVVIVTEDAKTRENFATMLDQLLEAHKPDLVVVDPAFAYIGGDASSQKDVSAFLRNMVNPVIHKHNVGFILVHHVNKPPTGEQKSNWQAGDFAYLGSGSAEFANWARGVIAIRSIGSDSVFELMLAKRGRRAGWVDKEGNLTNSRYIAYHREPGVICWRDADDAELVPFLTPEKATTTQDIVDMIAAGANTKAGIVKALKDNQGIGKSAAYKIVDAAVASGAVRVAGSANSQTLVLTGKIQPRFSVKNAGDE